MTRALPHVAAPRSPLQRAGDGFLDASEVLHDLPLTAAVRRLQRRAHALNTVLYGALFGRAPTLRDEQLEALIADVWRFVTEVTAASADGAEHGARLARHGDRPMESARRLIASYPSGPVVRSSRSS
jgi:hypothetical protein